MHRLLLALASIAAQLAVASAAPIPDAAKPPLYFPTKVGAKWVYQLAKAKGVTWVEETVKVNQERDGSVVTVRRKDAEGKQDGEWTMLVSAKGVFARLNDRVGPAVLFPELRLPDRPGDRWEGELVSGDSRRAFVFAVGPEEEVEVPAGRFRGIPVRFSEVSEKGLPKFVEWWASGVGVVKREVHSDDSHSEEVLMSFTPGKN